MIESLPWQQSSEEKRYNCLTVVEQLTLVNVGSLTGLININAVSVDITGAGARF